MLGENPQTSKAWDEEPIVKAFEGLPRLAAQEEILEECCRTCQACPRHGHGQGRRKLAQALRVAGGYTRQFSEA